MTMQSVVMLMNNVSPKLSQIVGRKSLELKKQAPHIMFGVGIVGSVTSTVLACRSTLKLSETLDEIQSDIDEVKSLGNGKLSHANYPTEENGRDLAYVYFRSGIRLAKLYGPSIGVGVVSIGLLSRAHIDLSRRNSALMAAYTALQVLHEDYRSRVRAELGDDRELDIYRGFVDEIDDEGVTKKVQDPNKRSPYARIFDEYNVHWTKDPEINRLYINCQQQYMNELLRARGHVLLNDVYDVLGFDRTSAGAVVGWAITKDGDNYIDFGLFDEDNTPFVNGWERSVVLDFNVDGVVYNMI